MSKVNIFAWLWKNTNGTSFLNYKDEEPGNGWIKIPLVTKFDSDSEIDRLKAENQRLQLAAAKESAIVDFDLLPLGSRFKYLTGGKLYVKISYKIVAVFSDVLGDRLQEVFSAFSPFEPDHMVEWIK